MHALLFFIAHTDDCVREGIDKAEYNKYYDSKDLPLEEIYQIIIIYIAPFVMIWLSWCYESSTLVIMGSHIRFY